MTTATLKDAEIFQAGTWNGRAFTEADLDGIVSSFDALNLAGRVPLKTGHDGADARSGDGAPALGWVESLRRVGNKLLATIKLTSAKLAEGIRSGAYRFCSVELLGGVKADTREIPWVLDAVALLGATQPAVGTLRDLAQSLQPMSRSGSLVFAERLSFSTHQVSEAEALRAENAALMARLRQQSVEGAIEMAIVSGQVAPAAREAFKRIHKLVTSADWVRTELADWQTFARTQPKGIQPRQPTSFAAGAGNGGGAAAETPDVTLNRLCEEEVEAARLKGKVIGIDDAAKMIFRRDPVFAKKYFDIGSW